MQTKPDTEVGTLSGARQVPLMRQDQIVPGAIFTGIAADHIHEVIGVNGTTMQTRYLPARPVEPNHTHAFTQHNNASCRCGVNQYDIAAFLPSDSKTPKVHVLMPAGPLIPVDNYSLYLLLGPGGALTIRSGQPSVRATPDADNLPVICRGLKIWGLTGAARTMLENEDNNMVVATPGD